MKQLFFIITLFLLISDTKAQFIGDGSTSKPYYTITTSIQGSPFFTDSWSIGIITTESGKEYNNFQWKFNLYSSELVFNINDSMYLFTEQVKEFQLQINKGASFTTAKFIKSKFIHNLLPPVFVQELVKGNLNFYKHCKKEVVEVAAYNTVKNQQFEERLTFYIIRDNNLKSVSLNRKSLEEVLKDKWAQVSTYMEQNNLSAKTEQGWAAAISYYNTL
ncbi:MAG: hypothetical protein K2X48_06805 [Chitinophagaceae bacterium]|nr:hypothetical protein [Chitinophagaceae bacterium]